MLHRAILWPKTLVSSMISLRNRSTPSRSNSSTSYSEEMEKLFRYTRGRWLYNERQRESLLPSPPCDSSSLPNIH